MPRLLLMHLGGEGVMGVFQVVLYGGINSLSNGYSGWDWRVGGN